MEIQLKIDLTDEQYKELMETNYQKLFEVEDFQKALGDLILNNIAARITIEKVSEEIANRVKVDVIDDEELFNRVFKLTDSMINYAIDEMVVEVRNFIANERTIIEYELNKIREKIGLERD